MKHMPFLSLSISSSCSRRFMKVSIMTPPTRFWNSSSMKTM